MVTWWNPSIHCPLISSLLWPGCLGCWGAGWLLFYVNLAMSLYLWLYRQSSSSRSTPSGSWWWSDQNCRLKVSFFFFFLAALITAGRPPSLHPLMNINLCVTKEVFVLIYFRRVGNKKDTGVRYRRWDAKKKKWTISWLISHANVLIFIISRIARSVGPPPSSSPLQHH